MLVFIDESGDAGFKLDRGSSQFFVMAMVMFETDADAALTQAIIAALQQHLKAWPEFKFNKCDDGRRDAFFDAVGPMKFQVRAVVVDKSFIRSDALKNSKESFYKMFCRQMMQHDGGRLKEAKVVIDGSGDRTFKREFHSYIRKHIAKECVAETRLKDSDKDHLVQLADMVAGAIARSYKHDRQNANRWRRALAVSGHLQDVWEFR